MRTGKFRNPYLNLCFPVILLLALHGVAEEKSPPTTEQHSFEAQVSRHVEARYLLSLPAGYPQSRQQWPLILFLHGGSARGDDLDIVGRYGPPAMAAGRPDFPFIVVSPQCPKGEIWTDTDLLVSLLDDVIARYRVDRQRIYITGASMGGRGTWYLAYKHPDRFAAIIPVCAWAPSIDWARALKNTPVWVFHGDNDKEVPITESIAMVKALRAQGGDPKFSVLPGRDHFIADVYERPDIYQWLLEHRLGP